MSVYDVYGNNLGGAEEGLPVSQSTWVKVKGSPTTARAGMRRAQPALPCLPRPPWGAPALDQPIVSFLEKRGRDKVGACPRQMLPGLRGGTSVCSGVTSGFGKTIEADGVKGHAKLGCCQRSRRRCWGAAPGMGNATRRTTRRGRGLSPLPSTSPQRSRTPNMMVS